MSTPAPRAGPRRRFHPGRRPSRPLVLATLLGAVVSAVPAGPAQAATWSVVATPDASAGLNVFVGVDAPGPNDVWAVGHADHSPSEPFQRPLAARFNGTSWQLVGTPTLGAEG